jgi:Mg/Co/Ni transporter MgtE
MVSGLPVVDKDNKLIGCISVRNIQKIITGNPVFPFPLFLA